MSDRFLCIRAKKAALLRSFVLIHTRSYKLKSEAAPKQSAKSRHLLNMGINYLYRCVLYLFCTSDHSQTDLRIPRSYGAMIVFANYLLELRQWDSSKAAYMRFPAWLQEHREITTLLTRRTLD